MKIEIKGAAEFVSKVKNLKGKTDEVIREVALKAAIVVIDEARPTVPRQTGAAASTLQAYATASGAKAEGGEGIEYYRWLELGGLSGVKHSVSREIVPEGRYIYPGYTGQRKKIEEMASQEFARIARKAGLEVK